MPTRTTLRNDPPFRQHQRSGEASPLWKSGTAPNPKFGLFAANHEVGITDDPDMQRTLPPTMELPLDVLLGTSSPCWQYLHNSDLSWNSACHSASYMTMKAALQLGFKINVLKDEHTCAPQPTTRRWHEQYLISRLRVTHDGLLSREDGAGLSLTRFENECSQSSNQFPYSGWKMSQELCSESGRRDSQLSSTTSMKIGLQHPSSKRHHMMGTNDHSSIKPSDIREIGAHAQFANTDDSDQITEQRQEGSEAQPALGSSRNICSLICMITGAISLLTHSISWTRWLPSNLYPHVPYLRQGQRSDERNHDQSHVNHAGLAAPPGKGVEQRGYQISYVEFETEHQVCSHDDRFLNGGSPSTTRPETKEKRVQPDCKPFGTRSRYIISAAYLNLKSLLSRHLTSSTYQNDLVDCCGRTSHLVSHSTKQYDSYLKWSGMLGFYRTTTWLPGAVLEILKVDYTTTIPEGFWANTSYPGASNKDRESTNMARSMSDIPAYRRNKRAKIEDDGTDNLRDDAASPRPSLKQNDAESASGQSQHLPFACPFYKKDRLKHLNCFRRFTLKRVKDVKQHLSRKHRPPQLYCPTCQNTFNIVSERDEHIVRRNCQARGREFEGITDEQKTSLSHKPKNGLSEVQQWYAVWDIVFPGVQRPESPFLGNEIEEVVSMVRDFWRMEGPGVVSRILGQSTVHMHHPNSHQNDDLSAQSSLVAPLVLDHSQVLSQMMDSLLDQFQRASNLALSHEQQQSSPTPPHHPRNPSPMPSVRSSYSTRSDEYQPTMPSFLSGSDGFPDAINANLDSAGNRNPQIFVGFVGESLTASPTPSYDLSPNISYRDNCDMAFDVTDTETINMMTLVSFNDTVDLVVLSGEENHSSQDGDEG